MINEYLEAIKRGILIIEEKDGCKISLPFTTHEGHFIEILVTEIPKNQFMLTDMGNSFADLWLSGMELRGKQKTIFDDIARRYKLHITSQKEIVVIVKKEEVGNMIHNLVQALLNVADLYFLHEFTPVKEEKIEKEVRKIVVEAKIKYKARVTLEGYDGLAHQLTYILQDKKAVKCIDAKNPGPLEEKVEALCYTFPQIKRAHNLTTMAVYNENNRLWTPQLKKVMNNYADLFIPIQQPESICS